MTFPKLSLAGQVLTGITVLFLLITIATSLVSAWNLDRQLTREFETKGTAIANSIANSSIELLLARDGSSLQAMIDGFLDITGVGYVFVLDSDDEIVVHTFAPAIPRQLIARASVHDNSAGNAVATLDIAGMGTYVDVAAPILAGVAGTVHVGMDRRFIDAEVRSAVLLQGLIVLGIFAVSMALAYVHIVRVAQPLVVLTEHANRVASPDHLRQMASASDDVTTIDPQVTTIAAWAADEVGALAAAFQNMELELQRYIGNLRRAQQELEEHNRTLEQKVNQRTSELVSKNAELESTLDKLKQAQEQVVASEKLASLGALTAGIAHEIKNPLNFINNFAELSAELTTELAETIGKTVTGDAADELNEVVEMLKMNVTKINEHGKRADSIVRNMLLHSRKTKGERTDVDINALLNEYLALAYHGMRGQDTSFNAKLETSFDPAVKTISAIPQDLSRAFLNILTNGCYALRDKSKKAGDGYAPVLSIKTKALGENEIEIRIRDNGTGIPDEVKAKIFEPFFTTKPAGQGTGLGLSMTFDILVQAHRGKVEVDTRAGEFAEFIIKLPRKDPGAGAHA